ncbi:hypothetical protein [Magnetococcus sp. PR-3]
MLDEKLLDAARVLLEHACSEGGLISEMLNEVWKAAKETDTTRLS